MNRKSLAALLCLTSALLVPLAAKDDVPRGFAPLAELEQTVAKADGKKLVVLVVKGMDDSCPNCAAALDNGLQAVGSGVVKLFARAETIGKLDPAPFTPALRDRVKQGFTTGAAVTFLVFNPDMSSIVAEATRKELQDDKKATTAFKKQVQEAKRALK